MKNLLFTALLLISYSALANEPVKPSCLLSPEEKAYGLAKFWQEANYNFIFMDKVDREAWDSAFKAMLPMALESKDDYEYVRILQRQCALLNDGHTYISPPYYLHFTEENPGRNVIFPRVRHQFREGYFQMTDIGGVPVVEVIHRDLDIPVGSRIVSVNGMPVEDYIREYTLPYVGQNTEHMRRIYSAMGISEGEDGEQRAFGYITPDGSEGNITLTFSGRKDDYAPGQLEMLKKNESPWQWTRYREMGDGIGYLQLNSFNNYDVVEHFQQHLPEIRKAKALIIDLRSNGGGNTNNGTAILQYFTADDMLYGSKSSTRKNISAYKAWGQHRSAEDTLGGDEWMRDVYLAAHDLLLEDLNQMHWRVQIPQEERMIIPIVILTGYWTASAAEDFLIFADSQPNITRIGTRTFGSTGQPLGVRLPGGIYAAICSKNDTYPDGREFVGVGVIPDIEVIPTVEGLLKGEDKTLQTALDFLKEKIE